ncbi:MAG: phosphate ABC transporter permease subunit PstC [Candidatus Margulisbacteria bacterium]|jgi:phosphate transport system permease protein|nr:phosphate ABC transporter permease subunit PstC [Candidatus Margulisiibacteriota bacterium]
MLPSLSLQTKENIFQQILTKAALFVTVVLVLFFLTLLLKSLPAIWSNGFNFFGGAVWDPLTGEYGAFPLLCGTLLTSGLALLLTLPLALSIALFLGEFFRKGLAASILRASVELLAGIPSVVYGFWALFVLVPLIRRLEIALGVVPFGVGVLTASLVLAIMIIPYAASLSAEVIKLVPQDIREAAYSLGATRYEVVRRVILPCARSGVCAGILLAFGRAFGETMAVTMVIGNANKMPASLFDTGNTMASIIANELAEATDPLYVSSLVQVGLLLLTVSALINLAGKYIVKKINVEA